MWIVWTAAALLLIWAAAGLVMYFKAFDNPPKKHRKAYDLHPDCKNPEKLRAMIDAVQQAAHEDAWITSFDGLRLHGRCFSVREGAPLIIMMHGYRSIGDIDASGAFPMLRALGCNMLIPDQRAHGTSEGRTIAFGIHERRDCAAWVRWAAERFGADTPMALYGVSMGAATVLMTSDDPAIKPQVCCVVADCGYTSPAEIVRKVCRQDMHLPDNLLFPPVRLFGRLLGHFDLSDGGAAVSVTRTDLPILFIHGDQDGFVPTEMSVRMHETAAMPDKQLWLCKGANHANSTVTDPAGYADVLSTFLKKHLPLGGLTE